MKRRLNLTNDFLFCHIFGDEKEPELLLPFLNAILAEKNYPPLKALRIKTPNLRATNIAKKEGVLDIFAEDIDGTRINIEMQVCEQKSYISRAQYYLSSLYVDQLNKGKDFDTLKQCIGIHLLNFTLFKDNPDYHSAYIFRKDHHCATTLSHDQRLHFIELPKLNFTGKTFTLLEKWLYLILKINNRGDPMVQRILNEDADMNRAAEKFEELLDDEDRALLAISRDKWERDQATYRAEALAEGREEGVALGLAEGRAEGEAKKQRELALNLKNKGFKPSEIAELTGLPLEDVAKI